MWLIVLNMILHIIGITVSILALAFVNIVSFIEYGKCSIQQATQNVQLNDNDEIIVCSDLLKYGNFVMIVINFTIIGMLLGFLIKLIIAIQKK
jgi:large-conductance mechanosensitive channel